MKCLITILVFTGLLQPLWALRVGELAPEFKLKDLDGEVHSLSRYKGYTIVLEWVNLECPFVQKHYTSGHMQGLQKTYTGKGILWFGIRTGKVSLKKLRESLKQLDISSSALLLDSSGEVARKFSARATPHIFVIGANGRVLYSGAVDDKPTPDPATLVGARNYIAEALDAILSGRKITVSATRPYGCGIKLEK